jgi:hypothetical protein
MSVRDITDLVGSESAYHYTGTRVGQYSKMLTTTGRAASMTHEMAIGSWASARVNALAPVMQAKSHPSAQRSPAWRAWAERSPEASDSTSVCDVTAR